MNLKLTDKQSCFKEMLILNGDNEDDTLLHFGKEHLKEEIIIIE